MDNPARWKQRFDNFEKAYGQLEKIVGIGELSDIEKMALIQAFEFTFELAWKTMKDYLEEEGFLVDSPRSTIRQAFQSRYIENAQVWMEAMKMRNMTVHTYNSKVMDETVVFIRDHFFPLIRDWYNSYKKEYTR
jgi:nucleotidyltransferase substrate binding protein (TIGR01987 family)